MDNLHYACDFTLDFDKIDLDFVLNYLIQHQYELRIIPKDGGNKFITFGLKVNHENGIEKFILDVGQNIFATQWYPVSVELFQSGSLLNISQENREKFHMVYDSLRRALEEVHLFFRQVFYSQTPNALYRTEWKVTAEGLWNGVIHKSFNFNNKKVKMVYNRSENYRYIYFFVVIPIGELLSDFLSELPPEIKTLQWEQIDVEQLPNHVYGNPSKMDANVRSMWSEALWVALWEDDST